MFAFLKSFLIFQLKIFEYHILKIWTISGGLTTGERSTIQEFPDEDRFRSEQASRNHSLRIPFMVSLFITQDTLHG